MNSAIGNLLIVGLIMASLGWVCPDGVVAQTEPELRATLTGHGGLVYSVAFSPDGALLASGSGDSTVNIWGLGPPKPRLPPRLAVNVSFSDVSGDSILNAEESANLHVSVSNFGEGDAYSIIVAAEPGRLWLT